jgi:hypothetical protein
MSFTDFKEISAPTAGSTVKYGSQDILDIMQIFNGKTVAIRRPHIINPWRWDSSFDIKEITEPAAPSAGYQTFYIDSVDHHLKLKNSSSVKIDLANTSAMVSPMIQRTGWYLPTAGATAATVGMLGGALGAHVPTGAGTNSNTFDTTEGTLINLQTSTSAGNAAGLISSTAGVGIGRRLFGGRIVTRAKIDSTTTSKFLFGLTSQSTLPVAAATQPLAATDHGIIVGFAETGVGNTNWTIWHNDGATSVTADNVSGPIAKDANFHTIEINWTASGNMTVLFDAITQVITTDLPATTANLYLNLAAVNTAAAARTLTMEGMWVELYD